MDGRLWLLLTLFLILILISAYFSASESAFSRVNLIRMRSRAESGNKRAKSVIFISEHYEKALTTLLIGNNITNIAAAAVATLFATRAFSDGNQDTVTVLCTVITTLIVFMGGEMTPKSLANDRSDEVAEFSAPILRFLMKILTPFSAFFMKISGFVTGFFKKSDKPSISEDELYDIIDTIEDEGVVDEDQSDLLKSALEFDDTTAADVMTMRRDIYALDVSLPTAEILKEIQNCNHTRIPVYEGDIDHIIGILQIRRFLKAYLKDPAVDLRGQLYEPFFVTPDAKIDDLLSTMRQHRFYLAIVRDEKQKQTLGIVTIEDFLEELVGEIWDEDDTYDRNFIKLGGNRYQINPRFTVRDAFARIGVSITEPAATKQSLASWINQYYLRTRGTPPEEEDTFRFAGVEVEVIAVKDGRVTEVVLHNLNDEVKLPAASRKGGAV